MYDVATDEWREVADLPIPLHSAKMENLQGKPTIIGGFTNERWPILDANTQTDNGVLYQYFIESDEWKPHPTVKMRIPRGKAAVFQVPRDLFQC